MEQNGEGRNVKRMICALMLLAAMAQGALAQTELCVFVADGALDAETARQMVRFMQQAMPEAAFALELEEESGAGLREKVLGDRAPDIAIAAPEAVALWAREGLLLPLQGAVAGEKTLEQTVAAACTDAGNMFMAPLFVRYRSMAVNRKLMEDRHLGALLNTRDYPVWMPMQMQQVLEEFALNGMTAMDVWPPCGEGETLLALVQAIYGAPLMAELPLPSTGALEAGVTWVHEMVESGLIRVAGSREEALERFIDGETAMFCGFTAEDAQRAQREGLKDVAILQYPSSTGLPVRDFTVTGAAVFMTGDEAHDRLAFDAVSFLTGDARVSALWGETGANQDGTLWLPVLGTSVRGAAVRSAFSQALMNVLAGEMQPGEAVRAANAAGRGAR